MTSRDPPEQSESPDHFDSTGLAPARPVEDDSVVRDEAFVDTFDDERLFCQAWSPTSSPPERGVVALMHGYGEHSSRYAHVAAALVRAGYGVMAIDARGAGRSTGRRGYVESYADYVRDYRTLVERAADRWPDRPIFGLGHSNGGLILLRYALAHGVDSNGLAGLITTSPFLGFQIDVPGHKAAAARMLSRVWPWFSLPNNVEPSWLSHDSRVVDAYEEDPLVLRVATARWFTETLEAQRDLARRADEIDHPTLFLVAGSDELADPSVTDDVFHELGAADREMEVYPNLYHEILNEPTWASIVDRMIDWMTRQHPDASKEAAA